MEQASIPLYIVEDHQLTRQGLIYILNKQPHLHIMGESEDGQHAWEALQEGPLPQVMLVDIGLPVMDGITLTQKIKTLDANIKVIILTSHNDKTEIFAALGAGADAYCLKDIKTERLLQVIDMVLDGAIWLDPAIAQLVKEQFIDSGRQSQATNTESPGTGLRNAYRTDLTDRELEVLEQIVEGKNNKQIAEDLCITVHTVKSHIANILQKLAVDDRTQLAIKALREGLIKPR